MLFNSPQFLFAFLPATLIGFWLLGRFATPFVARLWLIAASLVFYGWFEWGYLFLITGSVVVNYGCAVAIRRLHQEGRVSAARAALVAGIAANVATLAYFKYINFLLDSVAFAFGFEAAVFDIILPLAISFFTFQQIAYLVDSYHGRVSDHGFFDYALFVCFFPQLIAGPIVHHSEMMPQFRRQEIYRLHFDYVDIGGVLVLLGLFKKVVFADGLAPLANDVFAAAAGGAPVTFFEAWLGTLAFTLQIYFDFSGYSDIAIGLGLMLGIRLPENFRSPYQAASIIEFWRRWHMTLSRFLRDYVYIPLGGNRHGRTRRYANLLMTMLIGGLWHGANWTFVMWGGLHGLYLAINHAWRWAMTRMFGGVAAPTAAGRLLGWAVTFLAVTVAWVFFRAESFTSAILILQGMAGQNGVAVPPQTALLFGFAPASWLNAGTYTTLFGERYFFELVGTAMLVLIALAVALWGRTLLALTPRMRRWLLIPTAAFAIKAVVFGDTAVDFIYFQF